MNLKKAAVCFIMACGLISADHAYAEKYVKYVNPFIGTANYGTCNPGAVVPNGMMSVVPFNVMGSDKNKYDKDSRWWSTPYDNTNSFFTGFAHGALSGVGCPEMGSLLTIATSGDLTVDYHDYGSLYSNENAYPGYYSLTLDKYGITAEATATKRSSIERYTFENGGKGNLIINLGEGLTNETGAMVRKVSPTEIEGIKLLGTFCYNPQAVFPVYFVARISKQASSQGYYKFQRPMTGVEAEWTVDNGKYKLYTSYGKEMSGDDVGYWYTFDDLNPGESVELRVGISYVSIENARLNLDTEQADGLSFGECRNNATEEWEKVLSRIRVKGGDEDQKKIFYTALYHALLHPNLLSDVNGEYPMMESGGATGRAEYDRYTVFSLWDTYRNLHQLLTLVYPEKQLDMLRSMVDQYKEWGWLPRWELYGRETLVMEGDPAIPVIVDSWRKGLRDFDIDAAYEAMKKSATTSGSHNLIRPDIDPYLTYGYIPVGYFAGDMSGDNSVSHALEYYVADNALSHLAGERGDSAFADSLAARAKAYRCYYSEESGTMRPLNEKGEFLTPFNPRQGVNFEPVPGFHEGSAWNYTFYIPHDIDGLCALMGGEKAFVDKLQYVFDSGIYDPSNEPDIAYPYLFSYIKGEEWRTQKLVSELLSKHFSVMPDGIPGNDDAGTMSAWAIFSMMGFYPDCPGEPYYTLTSPVFDEIEIDTPKGVLKISKKGKGYVRNVKLGHGIFEGFRIGHDDLLNAGNLTFELEEK